MTDPSAQAVLDDAFGSPGGHPTIAESVAGQLRELILTGKLPPGTPLRLSKVANRMGVSVMPIREAIRILEAERLVTVEPRRGASVARLSIDDIEELYAVRSALEGLAARHGTTLITAKGIKAMRAELAAMAKASDAGDRGGFLAHDRRFHDELYRASGRPRLVARIDELLESGRRIVDPYVYRPWYPLKVTTEAHRPILEAVEARDATLAEALIRDNIAKAGERAIVAFEEDRDREMGGDAGEWPDEEVPGLA
jgi:DNA-binding GntR family transcriptional regulator